MHGLYPIIRRVRRPLIVQAAPVVSAEPKSVNEVSGATPVLPEELSDAQTTDESKPGPTLGTGPAQPSVALGVANEPTADAAGD
jgi:hypothetical protein